MIGKHSLALKRVGKQRSFGSSYFVRDHDGAFRRQGYLFNIFAIKRYCKFDAQQPTSAHPNHLVTANRRYDNINRRRCLRPVFPPWNYNLFTNRNLSCSVAPGLVKITCCKKHGADADWRTAQGCLDIVGFYRATVPVYEPQLNTPRVISAESCGSDSRVAVTELKSCLKSLFFKLLSHNCDRNKCTHEGSPAAQSANPSQKAIGFWLTHYCIRNRNLKNDCDAYSRNYGWSEPPHDVSGHEHAHSEPLSTTERKSQQNKPRKLLVAIRDWRRRTALVTTVYFGG